MTLAGELDSCSAPQCEKEIAPLLGGKRKKLVLDPRNLKHISSAGLRLVIKARKALAGHGGELELRNMTAPAAKVFEIAAMLPSEIKGTTRSADIFLDAVQRRETLKRRDVSD